MNKFHTLKSRQSGAALGVGLIMLLVMTLLGVSNMSQSTLELRMAANAQNKNHAFQVVSSNIDNIVATGYPVLSQTPLEQIDLPVFSHLTSASRATSVRPAMYRSSCPPGGGAVYDLNMFECIFFDIPLTGVHQPSGSRSMQTQTVAIVAAKSFSQ